MVCGGDTTGSSGCSPGLSQRALPGRAGSWVTASVAVPRAHLRSPADPAGCVRACAAFPGALASGAGVAAGLDPRRKALCKRDGVLS